MVSNEMYKYGGEVFMNLIAKFLQLCFTKRYLPSKINASLLYPIAKSNKKPMDDIGNVRPICVGETLASVLEGYFLHIIVSKYNENSKQFGFRPNYSCSHAMFCLNELIQSKRREGKTIYACFLDYTKAFDKLNRTKLLLKLHEIIPSDIWIMIKIYYDLSYIVVVLKNQRSQAIKTTIGVKQGGKMSPKLYSIYANGMIDEAEKSGKLCEAYGIYIGIICYADDTTVCCNTREDLQAVLQIIEKYCNDMEITINTSKTYTMIIGKSDDGPPLQCMGNSLQMVKKFKFLGVWLQDDCKWKEHIKMRKFSAFNSYYALKGLGLENYSMPVDLKIKLIKIYCTTTLTYGMQCCDLNIKDVNDLHSTEAQLIKRSLNISKYAKTTPLYNALYLNNMETTLTVIKLKFLIQLMNNELCMHILKTQMLQPNKLHKSSLLNQIAKLLNMKLDNFSLSMTEAFLNEIEEATETNNTTQFESVDSYLIRHCLEHRSSINDQVVKSILQSYSADAG
jgi:hypothetical protein